MSKLLKRSSIIALALVLSSLGQAASLHGKNFADKTTVKGSELVLNGIGTRIAFMVVKVYVAALYVDKKTNNAEEILKSSSPHLIEMQFLSNVDKKKIRDAWDDGLRKNMSPEDFAKVKDTLAKLKNATPNLRKDDKLSFELSSTNITMLYNGKQVMSEENELISKSFLKIFLGNNPPNSELKDGMLGLAN